MYLLLFTMQVLKLLNIRPVLFIRITLIFMRCTLLQGAQIKPEFWLLIGCHGIPEHTVLLKKYNKTREGEGTSMMLSEKVSNRVTIFVHHGKPL